MENKNMISITVSGQTINEVEVRLKAMVNALKQTAGEEPAASSKKGAPENKMAGKKKPAKVEEVEDGEDFEDEELEEEEESDEDEGEEDGDEEEEEDEDELTFEDVKKTLTKLGVKDADAPRNLLAKYKLKGLKDLMKKPKLFKEINDKAAALLKKKSAK